MTASFDKFTDATVQDILRDPAKYGVPTLAEFMANPEKWRGKSEQWFEAIDKGSSNLARKIKKQYYTLKGYRVDSLEALERLAGNMGYDYTKLVPQPQVRDLGGQWCDLEVVMVDPAEQKAKEEQTNVIV